MKLKRGILVVIVCTLFLLPLVTNDFDVPRLMSKTKLSQDPPTLTGVFDDYGVDTDSNGKFDYLAIDVQVQVTVVGEYTVYIDYLNGSGASINVYNETVVDILSTGTQYITVYLNGETIHDRGADGPYTVNYVELYFYNGTDWADDYLDYPYTTGAYSYTDFDTPGPTLDDPYLTGTYAEYGIDTNGNGKYEFLAIDVEFNATLTGTYDVYAGELIGENSTYIYTSNTTEFEVVTPDVYTVTVYLDGREIYDSGANGPYTVWSASIQLGSIYDSEWTPLVTRYYDYTDFEPPEEIVQSTLTGTFSDSGIDTNVNGKFEYLEIDVELNITVADIYEVQIVGLIDAEDELFYASGSVEESLEIGIREVTVQLDGTEIYESGKNGPYTLLYVSLSSDTHSHFLSEPYTTSYYSYSDFEAPPVYPYTTEIFTDYVLDTDSDTRYDFLVIQVEINVTMASDISVTVSDLIAIGVWISISGTEHVGYLSEGLHNITVYLPGEQIFLSETDGPYKLWSVSVTSDTHTEVCYPHYTTAYYSFTDFEPTLIISNLYPAGGELLSSTQVIFSWTTNLNSTTEVYLRPADGSYDLHTGEDGIDHLFTVDDLEVGSHYEFYVSSYSSDEDIRTDSPVHTFVIGSGIGFSSSFYNAMIQRDYNQELSVSVANFDSYAHRLLMVVESPYNDIILGFVGNGSIDRPVYLNPLEQLSVPLIVHAQDAMQQSYTINLKLINLAATPDEDDLVDYAVLNLLLDPDIVVNITLVETADDSNTLTKTFNLTNYGSTLTDLRVYADNSLYPHITWDPRISHIRLEQFESRIFKARYVYDWTFNGTASGTIYARAYNVTKELSIVYSADGEVFFGGGDALFTDIIDSWFCTNRPTVEEQFGLLPGILPDDGFFGEVITVIGDVKIGGEVVNPGYRIYSWTSIDTGPYGSVTIETIEGGIITFGPNTRVGIRPQPSTGEAVIDFIKGVTNVIWSQVTPVYGPSGPPVYCNGWIGMRGTHFKLTYDDSTGYQEILLFHGALERYDNRTDTWQGLATDDEFGLTFNIIRQYNHVTSDYDLLFRNSTDFGKTWFGNQTLLSSANLENISMTIGPNNTILVAYELNDAIYYIWSDDNGTTWSIPELAVASGATNPYLLRIKDTDIVRLGWTTDQGTYYEETIDLGTTWSAIKRAPSYTTNAIEAYIEVDFEPWWKYEVLKHDVSISINDHEVAFLHDLVPRGRYLFPIALEYLNFSTNGKVAQNTIKIETWHLNGGHYVVLSDIRVILRLTDVVVPVFCTSQIEADALAKTITNIGFNVTDIGVYANLLESPEVVRIGTQLTFNATIVNLADNPVSDAIIQFFIGNPSEGQQLGTDQILPTILPGESVTTSIDWTPLERGDFKIYVQIVSPSDEYDDNNLDYRFVSVRSEIDAPHVSVTYPNGGELVNGTIYITWTADDPNPTETLIFDIYYGDGTDWTLINHSIDYQFVVWDTTYVPNGQYKVMVNASDGFFVTGDISDDFFTVENLVTTTTEPSTVTTTPTTTTTPHTPWYEQEILGIQLWIWLAIGSTGIILVIVIIMAKKRRGG
ncbi:MAG: hypothetical protein RTU92_11620 [Candidatus Thorarchaeota archaeon]